MKMLVLSMVGKLKLQKRMEVDYPVDTFAMMGSEIDHRTGWNIPVDFPSCSLKDCNHNLDRTNIRLLKDIQSRASVEMVTSLLWQLLLRMHP